MSGKSNRKKPPAGKSGLNTEKTNEGQPQDQDMNPGGSSVTAVVPTHSEMTAEDAPGIKAFEALYGESPPKDPEAINVDKDDEVKDNEEEDVFLLPESQNFAPGTAEDFTEKLRFNGLRWRHEVRQRVKKDPRLIDFLLWVSDRPSPMDEPTRSLGQMLHDIKNLHGEAEQIIDMGDGFVQMPNATFERHLSEF